MPLPMAGMRMPEISRRNLMIGGGAGLGLLVAWQMWPRRVPVRLTIGSDERPFGPYIKIATNGRVTVAVPQSELGQGVYTSLPQIVADELGADWRTIAIEAAPYGAEYANSIFGPAWQTDAWPVPFSDAPPLMITGGSSSVRAYEMPLRQAGAAARALLCMAAAKRLDADWQTCDTYAGFVTRGDDRIRFAELADEAAMLSLPSGPVPLREGSANRLTGKSVPRLDVPAKIDGSAQFAADIRLPDMVFASIAQGPLGETRYVAGDLAAAQRVVGVLGIETNERWVACVATNSWAAMKGLEALRPRFATTGAPDGGRALDRALDVAFENGHRIVEAGDLAGSFSGEQVITSTYRIGLRPHAAIEPMAATATLANGRLILWIACHAPELAVRAAARATGLSPQTIDIIPMLAGGSFGRRHEVEIAGQVALLAQRLKRPVQLQWSRSEDSRQDRLGAAVAIRLSARMKAGGKIDGWLAKVAAPASFEETKARVRDGIDAHAAMRAHATQRSDSAVDGALPPYAIPNLAIDHHPAAIGIPTGDWRGGAHVANVFARESFIDELAALTNRDAFSFRIGLLGGNARLAQCLVRVAAIGGWQGGAPGTGQGIACHTMADSHIAIMAEAARGEDGRVRTTRLIAVVDCGRVINPDIVRQQIAGGLMFGLSAVTGIGVDFERGQVKPDRLGEMGLPRLADTPWITIELIRSNAAPGGVSELAVPPTAPAIVNALVSGGGVRPQTLPVPVA
jgi:isoquinoline 1-oxidoreductase subunit beta